MAKVPTIGTVKTRLQAILPPEKCAELAAAFLHDTVEKSKTVCKNVILAYAPAGQSHLLENIVAPQIVFVEQQGVDLGERMTHAFEFAFKEHSPVVMIGTDSPTFPADYLARAFAALAKGSEIVLGKSKDGGFYLIGLRRAVPNLFDRIAWSTPFVFERITGNIEDSGIEELYLLPEHDDVDTPEDFLKVKAEILDDPNAQKIAPATYRWLMKNKDTI